MLYLIKQVQSLFLWIFKSQSYKGNNIDFVDLQTEVKTRTIPPARIIVGSN